MIPKQIKPGDKIGVVSPSTPVTEDPIAQFQKGVESLENMGLQVVIGKHVYSTTLGYAASPQEKAGDIDEMFADPSIKAIICSMGGVTANASLPYLDWDLIKAKPKIFLGISDITVLLNAIYAKTGLVTFHGNDVMWGFGRNPTSYDKQEFISRFIDAQIGKIKTNGERTTIRSGRAEGTLLGGNLQCLLKLAGTPYFPDFRNSLFFVESLDITPEMCDCLFRQLKQIGIFDGVQGAVIGYIDSLQKKKDASIQMEEVLLQVTSDYNFPILKVNDFGHNCPNTVLPVGAKVGIDADTQEIEILEQCVKTD
jgi:muramoyltetrapeptide carboxypeptidase